MQIRSMIFYWNCIWKISSYDIQVYRHLLPPLSAPSLQYLCHFDNNISDKSSNRSFQRPASSSYPGFISFLSWKFFNHSLATKFRSLLFQKPLSWLAPCSLRLVLCKEGNIAWMSKEPTCDIITSVLAWTLNTEVNAGLWRIGTICSKLSPISIEPVNFQAPLL